MKIINKNNKGVALITVMITILFLSIVATAMLYISMTNFSMKYSNIKGKQNFYDADASLVKAMSGIRNQTMKASDPLTQINQLKTDPSDDTCNTYSVSEIAKLAYPNPSASTYTVSGNTVILDPGPTTNSKYNKEKIVFSSYGSNQIVVTPKDAKGVTKYTFKGIKITKTSKDGYKNTVKTDLVFDILESTSSSSASGGVGNMSLLLDSSVNCTNSSFKCMTLEGNVFMADYKNSASNWNGHNYFGPGLAALNISTESKLNLKGDNNVVYGDINLTNGGSIVVYGSLTVYGDIKIDNKSTFVIADGGKLYMADSVLPGRTNQTKITGKNTIPSSVPITRLTDEQFVNFCKAIGNYDAASKNDVGLINQIFVKVPKFNNRRIVDCKYSEITMQSPTSSNLEIKNVDKGRGYMNKSSYKPFKNMNYSFGFNIVPCTNDTSSMNGGYTHLLLIFLKTGDSKGKIVFQESNPFTTVIARDPIDGKQAHCVTMSKVGTDEFNFMTAAKGDAESDIYNDNSKNPYNSINFILKGDGISGESKVNGFAFGTIFASTCNKSVDDMFGASTNGTGDGGKSYVSAMNFSNYERDFE